MVSPSYPLTIDPNTGVAAYPWTPVPAFSPPERWSLNLLLLRDPARLSRFIPPEWANMDAAKVPMLLPPWSPECASEIRDLYSLMPLRDRYERVIYAENTMGMGDFLNVFLDLLQRAGANLGFALPNGRTVEDHLSDIGRLVFGDATCLALNQKALFNRPRCYQISAGLLPMVLPGHPSYPSGHSTQLHTLAWTMWLAFGKTRYSDAAQLFNDYATGVARRREIAGVHYASDTVAGMALADIIVQRYKGDAAFKATYLDPLGALP